MALIMMTNCKGSFSFVLAALVSEIALSKIGGMQNPLSKFRDLRGYPYNTHTHTHTMTLPMLSMSSDRLPTGDGGLSAVVT